MCSYMLLLLGHEKISLNVPQVQIILLSFPPVVIRLQLWHTLIRIFNQRQPGVICQYKVSDNYLETTQPRLNSFAQHFTLFHSE